MRHISEEFRFVARSQGKLLRFSFQRLPCLFNLAVFLFDFGVLFEKLPRFLFQLLVSLLQFFLPALQFPSQRLRLFEQIFRPRVRFDGMKHDTDSFG